MLLAERSMLGDIIFNMESHEVSWPGRHQLA